MKNLKIYQKCIAFLSAVAIASTLTGCAKKMKCNIIYGHAHKYISSTRVTTYRDSEREKIGDLTWTDETTILNQDITDMTKFNLVSIAGNQNYLSEQMEKNIPHTVYQYSYIYFMPRTTYKTSVVNGKIVSTPQTTIVPMIHYAWTTDENHSGLTGYMKDVTYKYYGYKTYVDDKGKTRVMKSELVDDIFNISREYPYFKLNDFYTEEYSESYKNKSQKIK